MATRELFSFQRPHLAIETESLKNRFRARGVFKTAFVLKLLLQIAVALENFLEIVTGLRHAMFQLVHLVFDLLQTSERSESRLMNGRTRFEMNVLVQQAEFHSARANHVAAIGGFLGSDETKDGALAGAVATDKSDVLAGVHL